MNKSKAWWQKTVCIGLIGLFLGMVGVSVTEHWQAWAIILLAAIMGELK